MTTSEHTAALDGPATMDAFKHPMVIAALARLGGSGGWARILSDQPLEDPLDVADAELLVSAKVLEEREAGFTVLRKESYLTDPAALEQGMVAELQQALQHARGGNGSWTGEDLELVRNQGRVSAASGDLIADDLLRSLPGAATACAEGHGRFLDVGTGVAAISTRLCRRFDGLTCVGIDVLAPVLDLARSEVRAAGLEHRIELRLQSVDELSEVSAYDLAWVPQIFIDRGVFVRGLARVFAALRPGGGLVVPTLAPPDLADPLEEALMVHAGHALGGGPIDVGDARALLAEAGFVDVRDHDYGPQVVMTAVRP